MLIQKKGESVINFKKINKILKTLGFSVPEIISVDEENGFMLIEDFGNKVFTKILNVENEKDLLKRAVKVLSEINKKVIENKSITQNSIVDSIVSNDDYSKVTKDSVVEIL